MQWQTKNETKNRNKSKPEKPKGLHRATVSKFVVLGNYGFVCDQAKGTK
jgi:hypothetical protein